MIHSIRLALAIVITLFTIGTSNAFALPVGLPTDQIPQAPEINTLQSPRAVNFTAVVALNNCSGSLVRFTSSLGTDPAMILTNGHCYEGGFIDPGVVLTNTPSSRTFRLLTSDGRSTLGTLNATRVMYATMSGTDMTLYSLRETYNQIEQTFKVRALTMSASFPKQGRNISIPSGYWRRIYNCSIDQFIYQLHEGEWSWHDSIRYKNPGCEVIGGTSGSPIVDAETYEVIGVNNTGNDGAEACSVNNPCEVDPSGKVTNIPKATYGQQTFWVYSCLDAKNEVQLGKPGCLLPKPTTFRR